MSPCPEGHGYKWTECWTLKVNWFWQTTKRSKSQSLSQEYCTRVQTRVWQLESPPASPNYPHDPAPWDRVTSSTVQGHAKPGLHQKSGAYYVLDTVLRVIPTPSPVIHNCSRRKLILCPFQSLGFYLLCYSAQGHGKKCSSASQGQDLSSAGLCQKTVLACYFCPAQPGGMATSPGISFIIQMQ